MLNKTLPAVPPGERPTGLPRLATWAPVTVLAALAAMPLPAENPTREFVRCIEVRDDAERLACYDRLANQVVELGLPGTWRETADTATTGAGAGAAAGATATGAAATASARAPAGAPAAPAQAAAEEQFGKPQANADDEVKSITARVIGGFAGWTGNTLFKLDNGQVWEQSDSGRYDYSGPDRPVEIRRAMFNTFSLSAEGLNRSVRVRRIE